MLLNATPPPEPPVLLSGAQVWLDDGRAAGPREGWGVVIQGERLAAVGPERDLQRAWPGARCEVLPGGVLLPGLIEGHVHIEALGQMRRNLDLLGCASMEEAGRRIAARAASQPEGWLLGRGWDQNLWPGKAFPTAKALDAWTGTRPALFKRVDGHAVWVNSAALTLAGITDATPDPSGGRILRDAEGHATGILVDGAADLVRGKLPAASPAQRQTDILEGLRALKALGFTSATDMGCDPGGLAAFRTLEARGALPIRVFAYLEGPEEFLNRELAVKRESQQARFRVQGVKKYLDGALGSRGARLLEPYADDSATRGLWVNEPQALRGILERVHGAGYQLAVHAIGDAANHALVELAAGSKALRTSGLPLRSEHAQIVTEPDARRFGAVHLAASVQPMHLADDHAWTPARLGPERSRAAFPWRTFLAGGAPVVFGSDAPVASASPFAAIAVAETRRDAQGRPEGGFQPAHRLSRAVALRAYTLGNAKVLGAPWLGRIRTGACADLLWVQAPFHTITPEALRTLKPGRLWVDGREQTLD